MRLGDLERQKDAYLVGCSIDRGSSTYSIYSVLNFIGIWLSDRFIGAVGAEVVIQFGIIFFCKSSAVCCYYFILLSRRKLLFELCL